jgi:hypothetical protein
MKYSSAICLLAITAIITLTECDGSKSADGDRYDSLFLGIHLGMDRQAFYEHCAELNRQQVFTHGTTNTSVQFKLLNEADAPIMMDFYPDFYKDKIVDMPVTFSFEAWAPWNKEYSSDVLFPKMLSIFERWYGKDFKMLEHPTQGTVYYKMDGKRRINLFVRDDQFVQAVFTDLALDRERQNEAKNSAN